jgi:hypothetical protein
MMKFLKMATIVIGVIVLVGAVLIFGGAYILDLTSRGAVRKDISAIIQKTGVLPELKCRSSFRTAGATTILSNADVMKIVNGLKLVEVSDFREDRDVKEWTWLGSSMLRKPDVVVYKSVGNRPATIQVGNGVGFEHLLLFFNRQNGKCCINVVYAYL